MNYLMMISIKYGRKLELFSLFDSKSFKRLEAKWMK